MKNIIVINELTKENDLEKELLKKVQELKEVKIKLEQLEQLKEKIELELEDIMNSNNIKTLGNLIDNEKITLTSSKEIKYIDYKETLETLGIDKTNYVISRTLTKEDWDTEKIEKDFQNNLVVKVKKSKPIIRFTSLEKEEKIDI